MNIFFWVLQVLLALHTVMGAVWKFSNSPEQAVPTLGAIPNGVWLAMSGIEILAALFLIIPAFKKSLAKLVFVGLGIIAAEMLLFIAVHMGSGHPYDGQITYWLVVIAVCAFIGFGRKKLKPLHS